MSLSRVKLRFKNLQTLWQFAKSVGAAYMEINNGELSLVCDCSESDIALATKAFGAEKLPVHTEKLEDNLHSAALRTHFHADRKEQRIFESDKRTQAES